MIAIGQGFTIVDVQLFTIKRQITHKTHHVTSNNGSFSEYASDNPRGSTFTLGYIYRYTTHPGMPLPHRGTDLAHGHASRFVWIGPTRTFRLTSIMGPQFPGSPLVATTTGHTWVYELPMYATAASRSSFGPRSRF
jgi:hypothetical protein